jgi:hypothetical protein
MAGAKNMRGAMKYYRTLYSCFDQISDPWSRSVILFGTGCFKFFLSSVPPVFQWIIKIIGGFAGDKAEGY